MSYTSEIIVVEIRGGLDKEACIVRNLNLRFSEICVVSSTEDINH